MNVIAKNLMGGGKTLNYLLAGVIALAASGAWAADRIITADYTLTDYETVDGVLTVARGATVDLKGYHLTVQGLAGDGTITTSANYSSDLTSPGGAVTWSTKAGDATGANGGSGANLFNNVGMSGDTSDNNNRILVLKANLPLVVTYDFGEGMGRKVNKYKIYHLNKDYRVRGPRTWTLEGLNDLSDDWTTLDSQSGVTWSSPKSKEFTFGNDTAYRYYRITITESSESGGRYGDFLEFNQLEYFDTSVQSELHISVPEGASATNSTVSIAGSVKVVKVGEGEFAEAKAGQTYTGGTVLTEGTYALAGTASLDWSKFTFGTDPAKPVTLTFGAEATLSPVPDPWNVGNIANITSTVYKTGGDWILPGKFSLGAPGALALFYHEGGTITAPSRFAIGDSLGRGYFEISGGTLKTKGSGEGQRTLIGNSAEGTMVVKSGGNLIVENNQLCIGVSSGGVLTVDDGGKVTVPKGIVFSLNAGGSVGTVNLKSGGVLSTESMYRGKGGAATFNFDGGTLVVTGNNAANKLFSKEDGSGVVTVTVSENGGTIDNGGNANSSAIANTITGAGGLTLTGSGTTTVSANQEYLGTTTVSRGTTLSLSHVVFNGPVSFAAGSTFNIATYYVGVVPLLASDLTLPEEGSVGLTLNGGAFPCGIYAICSVKGVTAEDGEKFSPSTNGEQVNWNVDGDKLYLTVGVVADNYWTGFARDGDNMSTPGNWVDGTAPTDGEDVDFSVVTVTTRINADIANVTFGTVTMGSGPVTFMNDNMAAKSFSDMSMVAVGENSMVTLDGDLTFGANVESYVCGYIFEGGKFVVTGKIIATPDQTAKLYPFQSSSGWISAKGLVNNAAGNNFYLVKGDSHANWLIGADGISGNRIYYVGSSQSSSATIKAAADFFVSAPIIQEYNLVLEPDGHKITLSRGVYGGGAKKGLTTVKGPGKVVLNYNVANLTANADSRKNAFTVADGGTLAIVPGAKPSISSDATGALTVNSGATLEVAESGTVAIDCKLSLKDSAVLGFNYTTRAAPVLDLTGKTVSFDEGENTNIVVKISAAEGKRPKSGANVLTSGGKFAGVTVSLLIKDVPGWVKGVSVVDGEIVLDVKPAGTQIIVR